jgi:hypothetical protein
MVGAGWGLLSLSVPAVLWSTQAAVAQAFCMRERCPEPISGA